MSKQYKTAVVIGRFQPFHNQHAALIEEALRIADDVVVLVGGSFKPRTPKDPFTFDERMKLIYSWFDTTGTSRVRINVSPIRDYIYSDATWAENVQRTVRATNSEDKGIVIVGCNKDESSFYLKMFPQWALHEMPYDEKVDATEIREVVFNERSLHFLDGVLHPQNIEFIREFQKTDEFKTLQVEKKMIEKYKKAWEAAPYPPTFVTADAVVIQNGHILLVRRKAAPGAGLLALPGGFLDQKETIEQAVVRELREETKIKVPAPVLMGSIKEMKVFDAPNRSARGRTITHAALITLTGDKMPKVKGSDDAAHAGWYPLGSLKSQDFFEDHYDIINYFKSRV